VSLRLASLVLAVATGGCAAESSRQTVRDQNAATDLEVYRARAPEITTPLTLSDALAYADCYNIDVWIAAQEREFQHELASQSLLKLLPSLIAGTESRHRSNLDASSSVSLERGTQSLEPSYASDQTARTWDISLTWNLLDFGISFFRARQQSSRVWMAAERERRVRQNLALEVSRAYWQAVTARQVAEEAAHVGQELAATLEAIRREIDEQTLPPVEGLRRQTRLLEDQEEVRRYQRLYLAAKTELGTLMGLRPGAAFELAKVDLDQPVPMPGAMATLWDRFETGPHTMPAAATSAPETGGTPMLRSLVEEWETEALRQRPELFEKDQEQSISRDEARIALAQMFPSFALLWRYDWDDNRFLAFNQWSTVGLRASWDLLAIPYQLLQRQAAELHAELVGRQRMALAVAILTQLHLAVIDCQEAAEQYEITRTILEKHRGLLAALQSAAEEGKSHAGELLEEKMKCLKAQARHRAALANLMAARARLANTLGRDLEPEDDAILPAGSVAAGLRAARGVAAGASPAVDHDGPRMPGMPASQLAAAGD
jgi:outer membrane protein TolC